MVNLDNLEKKKQLKNGVTIYGNVLIKQYSKRLIDIFFVNFTGME